MKVVWASCRDFTAMILDRNSSDPAGGRAAAPYALLGGLGLVVAGCSSSSDAGRGDGGRPGAAPTTGDTTPPHQSGHRVLGDPRGNRRARAAVPTSSVRVALMRRGRGSTSTARAAPPTALPCTMQLTVVDVDNNCEPLTGAAVYVWHCDQTDRRCTRDLSDQNYLRGVQENRRQQC